MINLNNLCRIFIDNCIIIWNIIDELEINFLVGIVQIELSECNLDTTFISLENQFILFCTSVKKSIFYCTTANVLYLIWISEMSVKHLKINCDLIFVNDNF